MKEYILVTIFFTLAVTNASETKNIVTDIIETIINDNRAKLAVLNLPLLDFGDFGTLTNLEIKNLENFVLEHLESPGLLSIDISNATVSLSNASATANFNLAKFGIPDLGLSINGFGDFKAYAENMYLTVAFNNKIILSGPTIEVLDFSDLYIHVGSLSANLTEIENSHEINGIINTKLGEYINNNLATVVSENKAAILSIVNGILAGLL